MVLISGPPCSGKTTMALDLRKPGDLVLDRDLIAVGFGSRDRWMQNTRMRRSAEAKMQSELRRVARMVSGRVIVVRSLPDNAERAQWARFLRASEVRLLNPGIDECVRRARADRRPAGTERAIAEWYARFRASGGHDGASSAAG